MAQKRNTKGIEAHKWTKGQSGNPAGKPKNLLTQDKVKSLISQLSQLPALELQNIAADPKSSILEVAVASHLLKAPEEMNSFNFVLERSIGKVKEVKEIVLPKPTIIEREHGPKMILGAEMQQIEGEVLEGQE